MKKHRRRLALHATTVRALTVSQLGAAVSGCDTTSITTEVIAETKDKQCESALHGCPG